MKKILLTLTILLQATFGIGSIHTTFYATPYATTDYTTAKAVMYGSGLVSANSAIFKGVVTADKFIGSGSSLTGIPVYITTENADLRYITPNYNGNITVNTIYATNYSNMPIIGGGGGITTENADLRYISQNYNSSISINSNISSNSLFVSGKTGLGGKINPQETLDIIGSFAVEKTSGGVDSFFISTDGKVGIGTETPQTALEVFGTVSANVFYGSGLGITGITTSPAGINRTIQFNDNGYTSGNSALQFETSTNTLFIDGGNGGIQFTSISTEPSVPPTGSLRIYSKSISGRQMPKWKAPSGVDTSFQPFIGTNTIYLWTPNTGTTGIGQGFGTVWPACTGTITHPTVANTNYTTAIKVMQLTNVVTTRLQILGLTASTATLANVWRGSRPNEGGFFMYARCTFPLVTRAGGGIQIFVGLTSMTTGMVATTDDKLTGDFCGFWQGISDNATTMYFMTRDNSTLTKNKVFTIPNGGILSNTAYDFTIYSKPNGNEIYYRMVEVSSNIVITDNFTTTNLPRNTIFMGPQVQMSNGTGNVTATTVAIGINKMYLECDN